jgi:hypothetical protein
MDSTKLSEAMTFDFTPETKARLKIRDNFIEGLAGANLPVVEFIDRVLDARKTSPPVLHSHIIAMKYIERHIKEDVPEKEKLWDITNACVLVKEAVEAFVEAEARFGVDISGLFYALTSWPKSSHRIPVICMLLDLADNQNVMSVETMKTCVLTYVCQAMNRSVRLAEPILVERFCSRLLSPDTPSGIICLFEPLFAYCIKLLFSESSYATRARTLRAAFHSRICTAIDDAPSSVQDSVITAGIDEMKVEGDDDDDDDDDDDE